jgi:uncharacterized membrane protein YccC
MNEDALRQELATVRQLLKDLDEAITWDERYDAIMDRCTEAIQRIDRLLPPS